MVHSATSSFLVADSRMHLGRSIDGGLAVNFVGHQFMPGVALHSIYHRNSPEEGRIYLDPTSPFTTVVSSFMIVYQERSLVIRPTSPENLCYWNQMAYTHSLSSDKYSIRARIDLLGSENESALQYADTWNSSVEFTIDFSSGFDIVPEYILEGIQDVISQFQPIGFVRSHLHTGFGRAQATRSFTFVCGSDAILDQLPIVQYTIMSSSEPTDPLTFVRLFPRDYIEVDLSGSMCKSKIRSVANISESGAIFGMPFISIVAIHIDVSDGVRLGFGEPI